MEKEIAQKVGSYNLSMEFLFPTVNKRNFEIMREDLLKKLQNGMNRKDFGVSRSSSFGGPYNFNYIVKDFVNEAHKTPYMLFHFNVEVDTVEINGETYSGTKNCESVKKTVKTIYKNWIKKFQWEIEQGRKAVKELDGIVSVNIG